MATSAESASPLLSRIRQSTAQAYEAQNRVVIYTKALNDLVVDAKAFKRYTTPVPYPLSFGTPGDQINFHTGLAMLRFGGSYEPDLVARTRNTLEDTIRFGLIGAHISRSRFDAAFMRDASPNDISSTFNIPMREAEQVSSIPGVMVERPGPLAPLVADLQEALHAVGARLLSLGYQDAAQFVLDALKAGGGSAERLVSALVQALPSAFDDACEAGGMSAAMHKNAQLLALELHHRMGKSLPLLQLSDVDKLTAVADADTITGLIQLGILRPAGDAAAAPGSEPAVAAEAGLKAFTAADTNVLRVAACVACHKLAERLGDGYAPISVALYINHLSRSASYKDLPRFIPAKSRAL
ncbi:hypothetical protein JKP88DRAFT_232634 [Tribonema minus]|uniref:Queuosine 5'-phosphate N-glycosylase/hydrolase n=1 Tax=Tribonema minus TaxID=303371 RepID=A0A835Z942_9STRA|nr:hypothetical protein JKP88DRAFT_232634 [Tribonema minus]